MSVNLRALLHRQADELCDALLELIEGKATPSKPPPRKRRARGPVIVMPEPMNMTPEERDYARRHVRRALGR